ncbi:MAG: MotA/TolQ/ExbB proton channel family protein [Methylococcaceae bacterium]|nr:MotA/TolQ/ExbB proton channel family protein [Methylococcaceae bacterium]MCI0668301.1 MotA/TolQ/ExbB proton channel family protein [Methylococcaceae bacterium]MCI0733025.1 MotA/TolQ/ExbB proton channel family protein [Methylococcaceae bacterium]
MQAEYLETLEFFRQGGVVSLAVAATLSIMSIGSWTIMVIKAIQARRSRRSSAEFLSSFWENLSAVKPERDPVSMRRTARYNPENTDSAALALIEFAKKGCVYPNLPNADNPFARIALHGIHAAGHQDRFMMRGSGDLRSCDEFIANALRRGIDQEAIQLETGLTLLASIGSLSPFVGLFGTVCGIYHALGGIATGGRTSVDQVAGPVGEALIMTAFGLAVAMPAVLAYNSLLRDNRVLMIKIENFAHDLHDYLTVGITSRSDPTSGTTSVEPSTAVLS